MGAFSPARTTSCRERRAATSRGRPGCAEPARVIDGTIGGSWTSPTKPQRASPTISHGSRWRVRYDEVDLVLVEGIFLLKRGVRERFDRTYWIECPAEVALARALARNQEGRPADELRHEYQTIYEPAQRLHLDRDEPLDNADMIVHV